MGGGRYHHGCGDGRQCICARNMLGVAEGRRSGCACAGACCPRGAARDVLQAVFRMVPQTPQKSHPFFCGNVSYGACSRRTRPVACWLHDCRADIGFIVAAPTIVARASEWCQVRHPGLYAGLVKFGVPEDMLLFFTNPAQFSHDVISQFGSQYGVKAIKASFSLVKYFTWIVGGLVTTIFFVYFLMKPEVHGRDCVRQMPFLKEETRNFVAAQIDSFFEIIVSFLQRQVVICLIEGALYGLGFTLVGLPYGFVIGFLLGVINLVPLLGTVICLPVALLLAFFGDGGSTLRLIGVTGVWACGQFADGYAITPLIQGNRTGLGFAGVIFSFVFWSAVFQSFLGLLLAIPLSAFCLVLWRTVKEKYIKEVI